LGFPQLCCHASEEAHSRLRANDAMDYRMLWHAGSGVLALAGFGISASDPADGLSTPLADLWRIGIHAASTSLPSRGQRSSPGQRSASGATAAASGGEAHAL